MRQGHCRAYETSAQPRQHLRHGVVIAIIMAMLAAAAGAAHASEQTAIPDWVIAGIAAVETGSTYRDGRLVRYRDHRDGAAGEVGPWQIAPAVLDDLRAAHLRARVRKEPVLAESLVRAWLLRCYQRTGTWYAAVAVYHAGPGGNPHRGSAYADRVYAAGLQ